MIDPAITEAIQKFPPEFGLRGFPGDTFRISRRHSYVSDLDRIPMLYVELKGDHDEWFSFAKGSVEELLAQVTPLSGEVK